LESSGWINYPLASCVLDQLDYSYLILEELLVDEISIVVLLPLLAYYLASSYSVAMNASIKTIVEM